MAHDFCRLMGRQLPLEVRPGKSKAGVVDASQKSPGVMQDRRIPNPLRQRVVRGVARHEGQDFTSMFIQAESFGDFGDTCNTEGIEKCMYRGRPRPGTAPNGLADARHESRITAGKILFLIHRSNLALFGLSTPRRTGGVVRGLGAGEDVSLRHRRAMRHRIEPLIGGEHGGET